MSMPGTNTIRRLVRSILLESMRAPDEPSVAPDEALGQYVFPDDWLDPVSTEVGELEKNTALEDEFFQALVKHYDYNDHAGLLKVWPELIELVRAGLYPKLLAPPRGTVFRLLTADPARAAQILGLAEEAIAAQPGAAHRADSPPVYSPRGFISSWTLDPETMVDHTGPEFMPIRAGQCTVLLVAETSGGDFMMNPETFARGWKLGSNYQLEYEVLAGGPIKVKSAAWVFHAKDATLRDRPRHREARAAHRTGVLDSLIAAVGE